MSTTNAPFTIRFDEQRSARAIHVPATYPPAQALAALDLPPYTGTVVVHGGAGGMALDLLDTVRHFLVTALVPLAQKQRLLVIDGATQSGVARILGEACQQFGSSFPLLGVTPHRFALYPGGPPLDEQRIALNPSHTHLIFVDGDDFGSESPMITGLLQASGKPGIALVINGGQIVLNEVKRHAALGNPIVTVRGTGRTADKLADRTSEEYRALPGSTQLYTVDLAQPDALSNLLLRLLAKEHV